MRGRSPRGNLPLVFVVQRAVNLNDLKKKPVVSMADGTKIGEVGDLVVDTSRWAIGDLYVDGKPGRGLLPFSSIKGIGPDAVTIEQSSVVAFNAKATGLCFDDLKGLHVVDGTGTVRGEVNEITYDASGAIESFQVKQGGVFGIGAHHLTVTPADIRGVGDKILTVDMPPAE